MSARRRRRRQVPKSKPKSWDCRPTPVWLIAKRLRQDRARAEARARRGA